jgi:hypothetical protein
MVHDKEHELKKRAQIYIHQRTGGTSYFWVHEDVELRTENMRDCKRVEAY